jgi:hypothetical protein
MKIIAINYWHLESQKGLNFIDWSVRSILKSIRKVNRIY